MGIEKELKFKGPSKGRFKTNERFIPTLLSGERFYTNYPLAGATLGGEEVVTLDTLVSRLREKYSTVTVMPTALDETGRLLENDVAIFVKK